MEYKKYQKSIIQITDNQELFVTDNNGNGVKIKNQNNRLTINKLNKCEVPNVYIYNANITEIINYIFSYLLEEYNKIPSNNEPISQILNNQYNVFLGKENEHKDINKIEFQIISYFKKE